MRAVDTPDDSGAVRTHLLAAMLHPLRAEILVILSERRASAREIAAEAGVSPEAIGHQLRRLRRDGLVHLEERQARRGVTEHYYRAARDLVITDEEFATLSPTQRSRFSIRLLRRLYADLSWALRAGTFDSRDDTCAVHTPMLVDERGWRELAQIHREAAEKVLALRHRLQARTDRSAGVGISAVSAILWFELPGPAVQSADSGTRTSATAERAGGPRNR